MQPCTRRVFTDVEYQENPWGYITQGRSCSYAFGPNVGDICILGTVGSGRFGGPLDWRKDCAEPHWFPSWTGWYPKIARLRAFKNVHASIHSHNVSVAIHRDESNSCRRKTHAFNSGTKTKRPRKHKDLRFWLQGSI